MSDFWRIAFLRVVLPIVAAGVAHVLTWVLWPVMEGNLSLLFLTAVMVSALYGGLAAGLLASFLGALASAFFYLPPQHSFALGGDDLLRLVAFVLVAVLVSWLSGGRRRWEQALRDSRAALERRVEERTKELRDANRQLEDEVRERRRAEGQILAYQERLRSAAAELSNAEERQRRQIAATLHDAIGHRLAVAVMKLRGALDDATATGPTAEGRANRRTPEIARACELVEQAIGHTRSLTLQLSPPILYELGLEPAVEWLADQVQAETGLLVTVVDDGQPKPADDQIRPLVFSAVRELLVNVAKHARTRTATIELARDGDYLRASVCDDGVGLRPPAVTASPATGFGLFNVRERFEHLGGSFDLVSEPGRGCRVTLRTPLTAPARPADGPVSPSAAATTATGGNTPTRNPCQPASC
jgi:signal transduction histidine kinase